LDYYLQCGGVVENRWGLTVITYAEGDLGHVKQVSANHVYDPSGAYSHEDVFNYSIYCGSLLPLFNGRDVVNNLIGDADFPAVISRNEEYARKIRKSAEKDDGFYNVGQDYDVYVLPEGLAGSWADGHVESFLAAPWAYGMFQEGGSPARAAVYADSFYRTFYRTNDSGSIQNWGLVI
jgi:hypothetical protein